MKEKKSKMKGEFIPKDLKKAISKRALNATKAISQLASKTGALVREGKTGYFSDEYTRETKWLS